MQVRRTMLHPARLDPSAPSAIHFSGLEGRVELLSAAFHSARPWPHVVIDDFLEPAVAARAAATFPAMDAMRVRLAQLLGGRSYRGSLDAQDEVMHTVFEELHGPRFTAFLEAISGVQGLVSDRALVGAGFHQGAQGSFLRVHADHNTHPDDPSRFRRVNVMLYLNDEWQSEWNGALELWDRNAAAAVERIEPKFNRAIILHVDDSAFHSYGPLRLPPERTRKALAAYYYTGTPAQGQSPNPHHTTLPAIQGESRFAAFRDWARRWTLMRVESVVRRFQR